MQSTIDKRWNDVAGYWLPVDMTGVEAVSHVGDWVKRKYVLVPPVRDYYEQITPNSTRDHKVWKNFEHYKIYSNYSKSRMTSRGAFMTADCGDSNKYADKADVHDPYLFYRYVHGPNGQFNNGLSTMYNPTADGHFVNIPEGLEGLKQRSLKAMLPKVKSDLSSLVSLYEIRDLLSLKGSLKLLAKAAKGILSLIKGSGSLPIGKALARETVSSSYLSWMFTLKPLLTDLAGIYRAVATYEKRVNALVNRAGTLQTSHFKCDMKTLLNDDVGSTTSFVLWFNAYDFPNLYATQRSGYSSMSNQRTVKTDAAVFRASMQFNYCFTAYQREHANVLGLLDALGVNFNPKFIWNILPWSFVVDWVVNVSSWLDQWEVKNMEPRVNILQYCWSVSMSRRILLTAIVRSGKYYFGYDYGQTSYPDQYYTFPETYETAYRRGIDFPATSSFVTSGLSLTELSLGAALLSSKRRRSKPRP